MLNLEIQFIKELFIHQSRLRSLSSVYYFNQWKRSVREFSTPLINRTPWMTFQSISILEKELSAESNVFEFGGGGSTLFCLDKGAKVITVEHNRDWFKKLQDIVLHSNQLANWTGKLIAPSALPVNVPKDQADPDSYVSDDNEFNGFWFKEYASSIDSFRDGIFDVVLIDGRSRPSCLKHSFSKVKVGGLLFLDNTERDYYLTSKTLGYLKNFAIVLDEFGPTQGFKWFTKTTVWRRIL